jgi:hypothetical protein
MTTTRKFLMAALLCGCASGGVPKPVTCAEPVAADIVAKVAACLGSGQTVTTCLEQIVPGEFLPYIECLQRTNDSRMKAARRK